MEEVKEHEYLHQKFYTFPTLCFLKKILLPENGVSLTLSSLGFFEHSQPGGEGGGRFCLSPLHRNFFVTNANQMKLLDNY